MFKGVTARLGGVSRSGWLVIVFVTLALFILFLWHLGDLTPGLSKAEVSYAQSSDRFSSIASYPINAPHKMLQLAVHKLSPNHPSLLRLPSVAFAIAFCLSFYALASSWFGRTIGLFGAFIFASLPLMVVSGRQATPEIMYFFPIFFMWIYSYLPKAKTGKAILWLLACLSAAIAFYTPGMILWLAGAAFICRKNLLRIIREVRPEFSAVGLLLITASLASLVAVSIKHTAVLKALFLVPNNLGSVLEVLKHCGWMILSIFIKTGHTDPLIIDRLPLLNILLIALLVFGVYAMQSAARAKAVTLGLAILFAVLAAGFSDSLSLLAYGLPAIVIFISAGLRYIYIEWRGIFPRNPVPKTFALVLIAAVAAVQVYFGVRYSLAAWPNTPATRAAYVLK